MRIMNLIFLSAVLILLAPAHSIGNENEIVTTKWAVYMYSGPTFSSDTLHAVSTGEALEVIDYYENWILIKYRDSYGYVSNDWVEGGRTPEQIAIAEKQFESQEKKQSLPKMATIYDAELMSKPSFQSFSIVKVPAKSELAVLSKEGRWYRVQYQDKTGYVEVRSVKGKKQQTIEMGFDTSVPRVLAHLKNIPDTAYQIKINWYAWLAEHDSQDPNHQKVLSEYRTAYTEKIRQAQQESQRLIREAKEQKRKDSIAEILDELKTIPVSESYKNMARYKKLVELDPENNHYQNKLSYYTNAFQEKKAHEQEERKKREAIKRAGKDLEIVSWGWEEKHGYAIAEGLVKNLTDHKIDRIMAVVVYYTASGENITYDTSFIEYRPLMPGQTSPFRVMTAWNPKMNKATIAFKKMGGQILSTYLNR